MGHHATPEVTHALHSHVTYGTLYHARGHSHSFSHPTLFIVSATDLREHFLLSGVFYLSLLIPREAEDFTRGDRHFKHVPPPTYLIWLSPKELYMVGSIQICEESASHSFHDKRSMLKVLFHIRLATEFDDL